MKSERLFYFSIAAAALAYYSLLILRLDTISPEIASAVLSAKKMTNWSDILRSFYDREMRLHNWYRPFTFNFTSVILFNNINPKNIFLIKAIGVFLIAINAAVSAFLAAKIFRTALFQNVFVFILVLANPLYFNIAYEGSGIVDPIFNIFTQLFLLIALSMLTVSERWLNRFIFLALGALFIILTSQERGLAIYAMLTCFLFYTYFLLPTELVSRSRRQKIIQLAVASYLFILPYYFIALHKRTGLSGAHYRTQPTLEHFTDNLYRLFLPLRLHLSLINLHFDAHRTHFYNALGVVFLIICIFYVRNVFTKKNLEERNSIKLLALFFVSCLPIPILFGGNSWHFFPASLFYFILLGRAIQWLFFEKHIGFKYIKGLFIVCFLMVVAKVEIAAELVETSLFAEYMRILPRANEQELFKTLSPRPKVVFYDISAGHENGSWPYGAGDLFKYVFEDPTLLEIPVTDKGFLDPQQKENCVLLKKPDTYVFKYMRKQISWEISSDHSFCN
jgi:hypothetical protein